MPILYIRVQSREKSNNILNMEVKYKELFLVTGNWNDKKLVRRSKQNSKEYRKTRYRDRLTA